MVAPAMPAKRAYKGAAMEGMMATWYARHTAKLAADFEAEARRIVAHLSPRARVLEVAPGPGYLAVELARLGPYLITGLDISHSFVRIASDHAARSGFDIQFRQGDAASMPFPDNAFDFIVCRAAFKNFADPMGAIAEMHRVLSRGGTALIIDMRRDASNASLKAAVDDMHLGTAGALLTRFIFKQLRKRAYSGDNIKRMAAGTPFGTADIRETSIGFDIWLRK